MTTFIGFNTIGQNKKFTLTDADLVKRDFVNALNINKGEKPGVPEYGTTIWSYLFSPQTADVHAAIKAEVTRIATLDPRLFLEKVTVYTFESGVRIDTVIQVLPGASSVQLSVFLDLQRKRASLII